MTDGTTTTIVDVGGGQIAIAVEAIAGKHRLHAEVAVPEHDSEGVAVFMRVASLGAPGDLTFTRERGVASGTRHLVEPTPGVLADAVHDLAKRLVSLRGVLGELGSGVAAAEAAVAVGPPRFPSPAAGHDRYSEYTVAERQAAWSTREASTGPPTTWLEPNQRYVLVDRIDLWALVLTPSNERVFTDGRTLTSASEETT